MQSSCRINIIQRENVRENYCHALLNIIFNFAMLLLITVLNCWTGKCLQQNMQAAAPIDVYVEQVKVIHVGPVHYESTIHQYVRTGRQKDRQTDRPTDI